jgi:integrase
MSKKYSTTTADFLEWADAVRLVRNLYDDGEHTLSLLVGCGVFFGLRISDLLSLRWEQILDVETLELVEGKTGKRREIKINPQLAKHIKACYKAIAPNSLTLPCFLSKKETVYSVQRLNTIFKTLKVRYRLDVGNFSTHSLRKTFGRRIYDLAGVNSEHALVKLSEIFSHSNTAITRRYLGLKKEEIFELYDSLSF